MNKPQATKIRILAGILSALLLNLSFVPVYAAALTLVSDTMTRQEISALSSHTIAFTASGNIPANQVIAIDFKEDAPDSYFTVAGAATVVGDLSVTNGAARTIVGVDGLCTSHVGTGDIAASVNDTTGVLTLTTCGSYSATTAAITINYGTAAGGTNRVTNPSAKGTYVISITLSAGLTDTGQFAISIPEASGDDQIPVTSLVAPSITFTVANTTLDIGTISTSAGSFSGTNTITIGTNASGGYTITVIDAGSGSNPGLYSSGVSQLIASNTVDLTSVAGYGGQCHKNSGSGTCHANYPDTTGTSVGAFALTPPSTFASYGSKPSGTDSFGIKVGARVSASQDAGVYLDTLTLIGTANF